LGANLVVTPQADSLPLEIGGVDYRPVNAGAYLPESDLGKLKAIFWRNNIVAFAQCLRFRRTYYPWAELVDTSVIGTWAEHEVSLSDGGTFSTGVTNANPWWRIDGRWFSENSKECVSESNLQRKRRQDWRPYFDLYRRCHQNSRT